MGTPEFAVPTLRRLIKHHDVIAVFTQPDRPVGRGLKLKPPPVKDVALEHKIPVYQPERLSGSLEMSELLKMDADFIVVVAYGQILKETVLRHPKKCCINLHSSLLPRWRGAAPIQWAILSGDKKTGVTTMKMALGLDTGDILLKKETPILSVDTAQTIHDKLAESGADLMIETIERFSDLKAVPQSESEATYAKKLTKEMGFLSLHQTPQEIDLAVRALNPWPGTQFHFQKIGKIKLLKASILNDVASEGLLRLSENLLVLSVQGGSIVLESVQPEGKKPISGMDWANGLKGQGFEFPLALKEEK